MLIPTDLQKSTCSIPEKQRTRLARYIRRRLLWIVPLRPWDPSGVPIPLPAWVRPLFAGDEHNVQTVLTDVELAVCAAPLFPEDEKEQWRWLKKVAYRIARAHAFREAPHLAALQPQDPEQDDEADETLWEIETPCAAPSPEEVAQAGELLALALSVWGDSERSRRLLGVLLAGEGANTQETAHEADSRRRNIAYRRRRVRQALEDLEMSCRKKVA